MGRLIDADEYEKRIKPYDTEDIMDKALYNFAHNKLISTPSAEKTGKWLDTTKEIGWPRWTCSACGGDGRGDYMFCPWCGARMEA